MVTGLPDLSLPQHQLAAKTANGLDCSRDCPIGNLSFWGCHRAVEDRCGPCDPEAALHGELSDIIVAHGDSSRVKHPHTLRVPDPGPTNGITLAAAVAARSLIQLLFSIPRLLRKLSSMPSRNFMWLRFAADQVLAYTLTSAGSATSGVTNLNRTGISHTPLPNFCKPLQGFCDHITISIAFTFLGCISLATSAVFYVIRLSQKY